MSASAGAAGVCAGVAAAGAEAVAAVGAAGAEAVAGAGEEVVACASRVAGGSATASEIPPKLMHARMPILQSMIVPSNY